MEIVTRSCFSYANIAFKRHPSLCILSHFRWSSSAVNSEVSANFPTLPYRRLKQRNRLIPARKPCWLPPAPSKLYRIPKVPQIPPDELAEILKLYRVHKTEINSILNYWVKEYVKKTSGTDMEQRQREEDEEHKMLMEINRLENERIAKLREERRQRLLQEEEEKLLKAEAEVNETRTRIRLEVDELVRQEKLKAVTYITREKLEEAIQRALDKPVTYNYAIDLEGHQYWEEPPPGFDEQKLIESKK